MHVGTEDGARYNTQKCVLWKPTPLPYVDQKYNSELPSSRGKKGELFSYTLSEPLR